MKRTSRWMIALLVFLGGFLLIGCNPTDTPTDEPTEEPTEQFELEIVGVDHVMVGTSTLYTVEITPETTAQVEWISLDPTIGTITQSGQFTALEIGEVRIRASFETEQENEFYTEKLITVTDITPVSIIVSGVSSVNVANSINFMATVSPSNAAQSVVWSVSNEELARITEQGRLTALKGGTVTVIATSTVDQTIVGERQVTIHAPVPQEIMLVGKNYVELGDSTDLSVNVWPMFAQDTVTFSVDDPSIISVSATGTVTSHKAGVGVIQATSTENAELTSTFVITVTDVVSENNDARDLAFVNQILDQMSLEEKIGQLFTVHYWTDAASNNLVLSQTIKNELAQYHFGNFILFAYNAATPQGLLNLTRNLQREALTANSVPAFISIDQEGGMVSNATRGLTHFPGQMAVAATQNPQYAYQIGSMMGQELRDFGIHVNFSPVLDVNNNIDNPIIGVRSYGDDPATVAEFGIEMFKGLQSSGVVGTAKHFPGHGDTNIDSHLGLPIIKHDMERLYEIELYPFIEAINAGIDSIMTTHIIFEALDAEHPATLSKTVLTDLLRIELGFNGLIVTDAMNMAAITNYYGTGQAAVLALQAGVDMLTYAGGSDQVSAYNAVLQAVHNEDISIERIEQSVRRVLLSKLEKGLFENPFGKNNAPISDYTTHQALATQISRNSITVAKGNFQGLDLSKSTLVISPVLNSSRYTLRPGLTNNTPQNSFAFLLKSEIDKIEGTAFYQTITTSPTTQNINQIKEMASSFEQVVIATSNANLAQESLVKALLEIHSDLIVVALERPYDIVRFEEVKNYIAIYGYTPGAVEATIELMMGNLIPSGALPVLLP